MPNISPHTDEPLGRVHERSAIGAVLAAATVGEGGALILYGQPGMGTTALLRAAAGTPGFATVWIGGDETESAVPFAGLHRLVHGLLDVAPRGTHLAVLALLDRIAHEPPPLPRLELCAAVLDALGEVAGERPVLCCLDDAHRLDGPSWTVVGFLARRLRGTRVALLIGRAEADELARPVAGVPACRVGPLDRSTSLQILARLVPPGDVAGLLADAAQGNPRALIELALGLSPQQRRGEAPVPVPPVLPGNSRLRQAYLNRLAGLPAATRWLLLLAAADEELDVDQLAAAAARSDTDVGALEPAEVAGLVRTDGVTLCFAPLARSVVYQEATLAKRRSAHATLAAVVDERSDPLRHHLHRAAIARRPDDEVAAHVERAARDAGGRHAMASRALERAAQLTGEPGTAALRLLAAAGEAWRAGEPHRARVLLRGVRPGLVPADIVARSQVLAGQIELRAGATATARDTLLAAAETLADRDRYLALTALMWAGDALVTSGEYTRYPALADRALSLRRADEPPAALFIFELFAGLAALFRGRPAAAVPPLRHALALAGALDQPTALMRASLAALFLGDEAQAHGMALHAAHLARADGDVCTVPQALESAALAELAVGAPETSVASLEGLRLARESGQDSLASVHVAALAMLAATAGDRATCLERVRQARALAGPASVGRTRSLSEWALAVSDLTAARHGEALSRLRAITATSGDGHMVLRVAAAPHLVEAAVHSGQPMLAVRALRTFDTWAANAGSAHWAALSARCHALLAGTAGEAGEYFQEALRRHGAGHAEFDRARTQLLFGQWLRRRRRPGAAREHLAGALATFEALDTGGWAEQARAELRAAGEHVASRPDRPGQALTPHQARIAHLVAGGATNREVAAQMLISPRTVDHHLRTIFIKLGVRSRVELARMIS